MDMKLTPFLLACIGITGLTGCANELKKVNDTLAGVNQVLAAPAQGANAVSNSNTLSGAPTAQPTVAQIQALDMQLKTATTDKNLLAARAEAEPTIKKVIGTLACFPDTNPGKYLGPYLMEGVSYSVLAPMSGMHYHPQEQCLNVARLDNWSMPAKNAIAFRGVYVSGASDESKEYRYELVKQSDGAWLFKRAGF